MSFEDVDFLYAMQPLPIACIPGAQQRASSVNLSQPGLEEDMGTSFLKAKEPLGIDFTKHREHSWDCIFSPSYVSSGPASVLTGCFPSKAVSLSTLWTDVEDDPTWAIRNQSHWCWRENSDLVWASCQEPRIWGLKSVTLPHDSTDSWNVIKTCQQARGVLEVEKGTNDLSCTKLLSSHASLA